MVTSKVGYLVTFRKGGKAEVYRTSDGGRTWQRRLRAQVDLLAAVRFRSSTLGWVVGRNGTVLRTTNGGRTWTKQRSATRQTLYAVSFPSNRVGYAAGAAGVVIKTTNGGVRWTRKSSGTKVDLYGVDFVSTRKGWVVGGGAVGVCRQTSDGGTTWRPKRPKGSSLPPLVAVDFVDASTGWVIGNTGTFPTFTGKIFKLTGGGSTWIDQTGAVTPGPLADALVGLRCVGTIHGYAVGQRLVMVHSDDGSTWSLQHLAAP